MISKALSQYLSTTRNLTSAGNKIEEDQQKTYYNALIGSSKYESFIKMLSQYGAESVFDITDPKIIDSIINVLKNNKKLYDFSNGTRKAALTHYKNFLDASYVVDYSNIKRNYNLILTGAPGTGKTYLARWIAAQLIKCKISDLYNNDQFGFVQFHPSFDYTDFVEGLRPVQQPNGIVFERKDGIFKEFCKKAVEEIDNNPTTPKPYIFIIDEINRGEISKIFGELFFSMDPGYRGKLGRVETQYQNLVCKIDKKGKKDPFYEGFYVPENVYIIGTMNDIDRSVESMDFAFRRRFSFKEIEAADTQDEIFACLDTNTTKDAKKRMNALNAVVRTELSKEYEIGAAYFIKIKNYVVNNNVNWNDLWDNHLKGVLYEYLRGMPDDEKLDLMEKFEHAYKK